MAEAPSAALSAGDAEGDASSASKKRTGPFTQEERVQFNLSKRLRLLEQGGKVFMKGEANELVQSLTKLNSLLPPPCLYYAYSSSPSTPYLRAVPGYIYTYKSNTKGRWVGLTIMEMFAAEFATYPPLYYRSALADGRVTVNGERVKESHVLRLADVVCHTVHRHEPPVRVGWGMREGDFAAARSHPPPPPSPPPPLPSSGAAAPAAPPPSADVVATFSSTSSASSKVFVRGANAVFSSTPFPLVAVVERTPDYIAVDKPPTMPVHPCGSYHFNSLYHALCAQDPSLNTTVSLNSSTNTIVETGLYSVHRLDRLTSGLMLIGRTKEFATKLCSLIEDRKCEKIYLARVAGRFPSHPPTPLSPTCGRLPLLASELAVLVDQGLHPDGTGAFGYWWSVPGPAPPSSEAFESGEYAAAVIAAIRRREYPSLPTLTMSSAIRQADYLRGGYETGDYAVCSASSRRERPDRGAKPNLEEGKGSQTAISCIGYDPKSDTSVVLCRPLTGRTHQIRLHLQALGFHIANDPNYGGGDPDSTDASTGTFKFGFKDPATESEVRSVMGGGGGGGGDAGEGSASAGAEPTAASRRPQTAADDDDGWPGSSLVQTDDELSERLKASDGGGVCPPLTGSEASSFDSPFCSFIKSTCIWCSRDLDTKAVSHFKGCSHGIWLHALRYKVGDLVDVATEAPDWAVFRDKVRSEDELVLMDLAGREGR